MEGEELIVVAKSGQGDRTTTYSASGAALSMEVIMTGAQLAGTLTYVTTYARVE
jgi:hypothetical protein